MTLEDYTTEQLIEEIERRSLEKIWSESGIISYDIEPGNELVNNQRLKSLACTSISPKSRVL